MTTIIIIILCNYHWHLLQLAVLHVWTTSTANARTAEFIALGELSSRFPLFTTGGRHQAITPAENVVVSSPDCAHLRKDGLAT